MNFSFKLPDTWPPEKVDFIHDFVSQLYDAIWEQYGLSLCKHWEQHPPFEDIFDDEDLPF